MEPLFPDFLPNQRGGVILLLESVNWDLRRLNAQQIARIRQLYFLDTDRTIEQLVRDMEILP